jgi:autotransporter passenger strand-loop-strand repeat protein
LELFGGATASGTTVKSGGTLDVESGFVLSGFSIAEGATVEVLSGGAAIKTTVRSGGTLEVLSGGTTSKTNVASGGILDVFGGATASGTTVQSGGPTYVSSGGIVDGGDIRGGTLELGSGAVVTGTIGFTSGGTLKIDGTGTYGLVAGFAVPDTFDLAAVNFASASKQFNSATDTLTVTDGTHSVSIELIGHYSVNSFNLNPEAGGGTGTVVTDPPAAASVVGLVGPHNT